MNKPSALISKIPSGKRFVEEMGRFAKLTPSLPEKPTSVRVSQYHEVIEKLHTVMECVADRVEMHKNIGEQRSNWNSLLLMSINTITLSAVTMAGIAATTITPDAPFQALKISTSLLYLAATGILIIMNRIQPSQLAEEQRNAARLFKQLKGEIQTKIALGHPTLKYVNEAIDKLLAIDRAYPLPLLGVMLEKFPSKVEPVVCWPKEQRTTEPKGLTGHNGWSMVEPVVWWPKERRTTEPQGLTGHNGWSLALEEETRAIMKVLEVKDKSEYLRLGGKALKINKALAIAGPLLTISGAIGSAFLRSSPRNSWAALVYVMAGAMASVVNTIEHGGQVGMVFEMYRSTAGFIKMMEESIESNLEEKALKNRENGEMFEMQVALQLGRSLSELRDVAASYSRKGRDIEEFGSKIF